MEIVVALSFVVYFIGRALRTPTGSAIAKKGVSSLLSRLFR